jgi:hypothetical protein
LRPASSKDELPDVSDAADLLEIEGRHQDGRIVEIRCEKWSTWRKEELPATLIDAARRAPLHRSAFDKDAALAHFRDRLARLAREAEKVTVPSRWTFLRRG